MIADRADKLFQTALHCRPPWLFGPCQLLSSRSDTSFQFVSLPTCLYSPAFDMADDVSYQCFLPFYLLSSRWLVLVVIVALLSCLSVASQRNARRVAV